MNNRKILITGATGGLGQALAHHYAHPQNHIFLTARNSLKLQELREKCEAKGAMVTAKTLDICHYDCVDKWIQEIDEKHEINIVFANAGVSSSLTEYDEGEDFQDAMRVMHINSLGVLATVQNLAERMRKRRKGHIVLISSLSGLYGFPTTPSYSASKASVRVLGQSFHGWLKNYNVTVTTVNMGFVHSNMSKRYVGAQPFAISADQAVAKIIKAVDRKKAEVSFPALLALGTRTLNILPRRLADTIVSTFFSCHVTPDADSPLSSPKRD